jgi:predicted O-methyltransferase YrrM
MKLINAQTVNEIAPRSFESEPTASVLTRLHSAARGDWKPIFKLMPLFYWSLITRKSLMKMVPPSRFKTVYMPVSREQGQFLYVTARALGARKVVEFGSSFGISTIYLASAMKDNGGGTVITTEIEASKCRATERNVAQAGLSPYVRLLEGDARQTLARLDGAGPIDLVFLDGWKDLYVDVLELLQGQLRKGAIVIADNVRFPDARPYLERVRASGSGFATTTLGRGAVEFSCFTG